MQFSDKIAWINTNNTGAMEIEQNMEQAVQDFIDGKRIALVGMSRGGKKFGNMAYKELKEHGYQVYPVHPEAEQIDGEKCYKSLVSLPESVDGVLVVVPPEQARQVMKEAAQAWVRNVWLQQGADPPEVLALGGRIRFEPGEQDLHFHVIDDRPTR